MTIPDASSDPEPHSADLPAGSQGSAAGSARSRVPAWWSSTLVRLLYQLRLATTTHLTRLLQTSSPKRVRAALGDLVHSGLVDAVRVQGAGPGAAKAWFLTPAGATLAETAGDVTPRPYRMSQRTAAGPAQPHLLAVTDTGCAFVEHARARGDECGPLDWTVEVAHRTRDRATARSPADLLITDAVLQYTALEGGRRRMLSFFLEVDRATMSTARLARKVDHYARYYTYTPTTSTDRRDRPQRRRDRSTESTAWRELYPVFPKLLIVITGAPSDALEARIADLRAWCLANPRLQALADQLAAGATTLPELTAQGPFAPIVRRLLTPDPGPVDATMREDP